MHYFPYWRLLLNSKRGCDLLGRNCVTIMRRQARR